MIDGALLRGTFLVHPGVRIDLHRGAQLRVPHEFLNNPDIIAGMGQQRAVAVPERVPADPLSDASPLGGGLEHLGSQTVWPERHRSKLTVAGEDPIVRFGVRRLGLP